MKAQEELREWYRNGAAVPKPSRSTGKQDRAKQRRDEQTLMARYLRANRVCEACGERPSQEVHHATVARGMGGTRDEFAHSLDNFLAVCRPCHRFLEGDHVKSYFGQLL